MTGLALLVDLSSVVAVSTFAMLFYYGVGDLAAMRLPRSNRRYPSLVPVLGVVTCVAFIAFAVFLSPTAWVTGLATLGVGILYYLLVHRRMSRSGGTALYNP